MKLKPVDEIPEWGKGGRYHRLLREFLKSPHRYVEVVDFKVKPRTVYRQFIQAVKRGGYPVKVHLRGDRVFLEKLNVSKHEI